MILVGSFACLLGFAPTVGAQNVMIWGEVGRYDTTHGNGAATNGLGFGGGFTSMVGNPATSTFLVPFGLEVRMDQTFEYADFLAYADFGLRIGNVSFGPGISGGMVWRPRVPDAGCPHPSYVYAGSSCGDDTDTAGLRDVGFLRVYGFSGFVKASFGPQGRAFLQAKYIYYPDPYLTSRGMEFQGDDTPDDYPAPSDCRDLRVSFGYVFGGGDGALKFLRLQYVDRQLDFERVSGNSSGVFDQKTRQLTAGFGVSF